MKWKHILLSFLIILLFISILYQTQAPSSDPTHKLDTSELHFKFDNGCRLKFSDSWIYFGDSNGLWSWIDNDGVKIYNLKIDDYTSSEWNFNVTGTNTNVTVTRFYEDDNFDATISGTSNLLSTIEIDAEGKGSPDVVGVGNVAIGQASNYSSLQSSNTTIWLYQNDLFILRINHSSAELLEVIWNFEGTAPDVGSPLTTISYHILWITAMNSSQPLQDAIIEIDGMKHGLTPEGKTWFSLQEGKNYTVRLLYKGENYIKYVYLDETKTVEFDIYELLTEAEIQYVPPIIPWDKQVNWDAIFVVIFLFVMFVIFIDYADKHAR